MSAKVLTPEDLEPLHQKIDELASNMLAHMQKATVIPKFLSHKQVKQFIINVNYDTLNNWVESGEIHRVKIGGKVTYERDSLIAFLSEGIKYRDRLKAAV